jgi:hypothetical protein
MRAPLLALVLLAAAASLAGGCASDDGGGSGGGGAGGGGGVSAAGEEGLKGSAVAGTVSVTLRTFNPKDPEGTTTSVLVNASSDTGRKLRAGRATSTVVRVIGDAEMGALLAAMDEQDFSRHATQGLRLDQLGADGRRRGVIVVERDGETRGIDFGLNQGATAIPKVYTECKKIILVVHGSVEGYAVSATTGNAEDADRVFQAPKIRMSR